MIQFCMWEDLVLPREFLLFVFIVGMAAIGKENNTKLLFYKNEL